MEPVYYNTVLFGSRKRRFRTKTVIYCSDRNFRMNTILYVKRHVWKTLMLVTNKKQARFEGRMCLNRRPLPETLAPPEVHPLTTTPIAAQPAAVPAYPPTAPPAQPPVAI